MMDSKRPEETPPAAEPARSNPWSYRIGRVSGIPIYLHFTFLLFLIFLALGSTARLLFVIALFACVALHELGHSLVALRYKIPVADITLYPIGGIARIEKQPTPRQELWIALAGPAVNVVIAALLAAYLSATGRLVTPQPDLEMQGNNWMLWLMRANVTLVIFNLIPAFPMDGGRVLRALLGLSMPFDRATAVAASVGQTLALVAGIYAILSGQWFLMFIALFIYMGAGQEAVVARQETLVRNVTVREAMLTDIRTLPHGATFREAADLLLSTSQQDFPVVLGEEVGGLLSREALLRGLASEGPDAYIASHMQREFIRAAPEDDLRELLHQMQARSGPGLVFEGDRLIGMVTTENLMEFLTIRQITSERSA